jgi:hypothetical protein
MKHGQISSDGSLARLVVVFFGCGLLSYLFVMRFWDGGAEPTNTARPALSQYKPGIPRSNAPVSLRHSSRSPSLAPPEWDRTSSVPEITIPELSQFDLVALESHNDVDRAQKLYPIAVGHYPHDEPRHSHRSGDLSGREQDRTIDNSPQAHNPVEPE